MRTALLVAACIAALPAAAPAAEALSPEEFRDFAEGWTLYFERDGERWGEEQFLEGGATVWRYLDGTCSEGAWRPYDGDICFYYGLPDGVNCWRVLRDEDGLFARLVTEGESYGLELRITGKDQSELLCGEPALDL